MIIAIIADVHDNLTNLGLFLKLAEEEGVDKIICCGDTGNEETLSNLNNQAHCPIILIKGNADTFGDHNLKNYRNIKYLGRYGEAKIDKLTIGICHEPHYIDTLLSKSPDLNFIFYGHTHRPWISTKNKATLLNPGTLGGIFYRACFALWNTKTKETKLKMI